MFTRQACNNSLLTVKTCGGIFTPATDYGESTIIEPTEETGYQYLEIVQDYRTQFDGAAFTFTADDLRLPLQLFTLRKQHKNDAAINARLDEVFAAIIAGDVLQAETIIAELQ